MGLNHPQSTWTCSPLMVPSIDSHLLPSRPLLKACSALRRPGHPDHTHPWSSRSPSEQRGVGQPVSWLLWVNPGVGGVPGHLFQPVRGASLLLTGLLTASACDQLDPGHGPGKRADVRGGDTVQGPDRLGSLRRPSPLGRMSPTQRCAVLLSSKGEGQPLMFPAVVHPVSPGSRWGGKQTRALPISTLESWLASIPPTAPTWLLQLILYITAISKMQTACCSKNKVLASPMHVCSYGWLQRGRREMTTWEPRDGQMGQGG